MPRKKTEKMEETEIKKKRPKKKSEIVEIDEEPEIVEIDEESEVKKKRPDVAKRKTEAKESDTTVVKKTFNSINKYPIFKVVLEDVLYDSNKAIFETQLFANFHTIRTVELFKNKSTYTGNIDVLQEINQDFYYKCLSIVSESSMKRKEIEDPILNESAILYKAIRSPDVPLANSTNLSRGIFQNLSLQMNTNSSNFFSMQTLKLFTTYLRHRYDFTYQESTKMINRILMAKNSITIENIHGNPIIQYYIDFFNKFDSIKPKELKKDAKYEDIIEKWYIQIDKIKTQILTETNTNYITKLEFSISELYNKIENVAEYCKNYKLLQDTRVATVLLHQVLSYNERIQSNHKLGKYDRNKVKLFSLLPTKSHFTMNHITICNIGLYNILRRGLTNSSTKVEMEKMMKDINWNFRDTLYTEELEQVPNILVINDLREIINNIPENGYLCTDKNFMLYSKYYWNYIFNINVNTTKKKFFGHLQTDGKAVSLILRSPKVIKEILTEAEMIAKILKDPDYVKKTIGLDPGYTDVVTCTRMSDPTGSFSVSTKSYYFDSKFTESNFIMKHKLHRNSTILNIVKNMPSQKTGCINRIIDYIFYIIPQLDTLMDFYTTMKIRDLKFKRYCFSQKTIDAITDNIIKEFGSETIVAFGDFSNNGCIKAVKGPVKKIERVLRRKCIVLSTDEYRTSKLDHKEQIPMAHRYSHSKGRNGKIANHQIYNVLYCNNNKKNSVSINRDVNASQNILEILLYLLKTGKRHPAFDRSRNLENDFVKIENQYNFRKPTLKEISTLSESIIDIEKILE
jgi:hypothetical protein